MYRVRRPTETWPSLHTTSSRQSFTLAPKAVFPESVNQFFFHDDSPHTAQLQKKFYVLSSRSARSEQTLYASSIPAEPRGDRGFLFK
jgi:hypothetical protein